MSEQLLEMPNYEKYKDSGVYGLGEIPSNWQINRSRNLFSFAKGLTITKENLQDEGIFCVNYGEIHSKCGFEVNPVKHKLKCVSKEYLNTNNKSLLNNRDFIFADTSEDLEGSGNFTCLNSDELVFAGYHTVIARLVDGVSHRYIAYFFDSLAHRNQLRKKVKGVKVFSITQSILKDTAIILPPLKEQSSIYKFLDRKITRIDDAVVNKQKQITLLKEHKQILIQNAVTRGLNPGAPMRNSGVEWIGEIPAHWEIYANRALFKERVEPGKDGLPLLSVSINSGVSNEELADEDNIRGRVKIEDKSKYNSVEPNDIVFNMMRAWQGAIGCVTVKGMVSPAYIIAEPISKINSLFFEYMYRCPEFIQQMDRFSKGITDFRKRLYWGEFKQLVAVVPPLKEQAAIVAHIETQSTKINKAITLQQQQIEKLKEYKATLINSAVTGKIKVPNCPVQRMEVI